MGIPTNIHKLMRLFVVLFIALTIGLVYWQVAVASQVTANVHGRQCLPEAAGKRGRILDRNGVVLAQDTATFSGCAYVRTYSDPGLAPLIGYYAGPNYSSTGIEQQYNDVLSGQGTGETLQQDMNRVLHRTTTGNDIYLTIDERIQKIVEQRWQEPYSLGPNGSGETSYQVNAGSVIVTNPHTGEILAWLSQPWYDANKLVQQLSKNNLTYYNELTSQGANDPLLDRPALGLYVPGSTFKTLTLMAALDSGHTTLTSQFNQQQALGPVYYDGHPIGPLGNNIDYYTKRYPVNTEYAYTHSDNVIFAQLGVNTTQATWLDYASRFYIGQKIPFDLPTSVSTVLPQGKTTMSNVEMATDAFGQGTDLVTPLQMSLFADTAANNGALMRPTIIAKVTDSTGTVLQTSSAQTLANPISSDTATRMRQAMYGVVACGPATESTAFAANTPWGMIGKTGTGEHGDAPPHGWFISAAAYQLSTPDQLPALTMVSMRENGGNGAANNIPTQENIYNDIFSQNLINGVQKPNNTYWATYCNQTQLLQS